MTTLNLEPTLTLNTRYNDGKAFIIIGAGGTGGYFIPQLARQVALQNKLRRVQNLPLHRILIIDMDHVSLSNLTRQNFISKDLEKNKAEVMAQRYGNAFETEINFLAEYITSTEMLMQITNEFATNHGLTPVFVDCVDNNATRVFIHEAYTEFKKNNSVYALQSGNEKYHGQVVCGHSYPYSNRYEENREFRTPTVAEMFPEILEGGDKLPTEVSCDEAAVAAPQVITTNMTAANLLFNFANIILTADVNSEDNKGLKFFAVTFDTQTGAFRNFMNKRSVIEQYIGK